MSQPTRQTGGLAVSATFGDRIEVSVNVNGRPVTRLVESRLLLSDFLRHELGLTGTHVGCEQGVCGACTVELNGRSVRSCLVFAPQIEGSNIRTVEALAASSDPLHDIQEAFAGHHGLQCGFCTPGFLMTLAAEGHHLTELDVDELLSGNLCRCTGYQGIRSAVEALVRNAPNADGALHGASTLDTEEST
jgi:aerobic-type carbon monoxide dehydrogenase small subunit (CoxS/CutS family)